MNDNVIKNKRTAANEFHASGGYAHRQFCGNLENEI